MAGAGPVRKAFVMSVNEGQEDEYEKRHNPIWPELEAVLKAHGASNYSIFLHPETRQLFAYVEVENEAKWNEIAHTEVCQRWWKHMSPLMEILTDHLLPSDSRKFFTCHDFIRKKHWNE